MRQMYRPDGNFAVGDVTGKPGIVRQNLITGDLEMAGYHLQSDKRSGHILPL